MKLCVGDGFPDVPPDCLWQSGKRHLAARFRGVKDAAPYELLRKTVGNGLDRSADLQPTSDFLGTVKTVPYTVNYNFC